MPDRRIAGALGPVAAALLAATSLAPPAHAADDPATQYQWALDAVGARDAWEVGTGKGTVIAVVDTGVDLVHEDLRDKLLTGYNATSPGTPAQDDNGQGTHVAGIAGAATGNGKGISGVAPAAKLLPIKALHADLSANINEVAGAIRFAADAKVDVIDVSVGGWLNTLNQNPFVEAVRYAWGKGSIVVLASGSPVVRSSGFSNEPAMVVAPTTRPNGAPSYSRGVGAAKWGMSAPGGAASGSDIDDIFSTYWPHSASVNGQPREFGRYTYLASTSDAAAHVAGAAAVLRSVGLNPQQTVDRLLGTAADLGSSGRDTTFGAGRLDLKKAVAGLKPVEAATTTSTGPTTTVAIPDTTSSTASGPATTRTTRRATSTTATTAAPGAGASTSTTASPTSQPAGTRSTIAINESGSKPGSNPWPLLAVVGALVLAAGGTLAIRRQRGRGVH